MTIDDVAKITGLIENRGMYKGTQLLSFEGLSEALYDTDIRGPPNGIIGFRMGHGGNKPVERTIVIADAILPFDKYSRYPGFLPPVSEP